MKMRWIYNWFVHTDYYSGEMIRFWFRVSNLERLENIWIKHMRRKLNAKHNKNS